MTYAASTTVSVERTKGEIEQVIRRYGADGFMSAWEGDKAMIQFRNQGRYVRFMLILPAPTERRFTHSARGMRTKAVATKEWEQACRARWRALLLVIKAKLEAVEAGIVEFEQEFLAHIVMPDGKALYDHVKSGVAIAYERGDMPTLLPYHGSKE